MEPLAPAPGPPRARRRGRARRVASAVAALGLALAAGLALWRWTAAPSAPVEAPRGALLAERGAGAWPLGVELATGRDGPESFPWARHGIDVRPGVRLAGPGRLAGRVVEREGGAGVGGLRVDLLPNTPVAIEFLRSMLSLARTAGGMEQRSLPVAVATSAADGSFAFEGVRAGSYFLDARGERHVSDEALRVLVAASGAGGPVTFHVRAGGRVLGSVRRPDGSPAAGARVSIAQGPRSAARALRAGDLRRLDAVCDESGRFLLAGITPGDGYQVHAIGRGFALTHVDLEEVRAGQDVELEIVGRTGATIRGRVVALAGEARGSDAPAASEPVPVAGARLAVLPQGLRDLAYLEEVLASTAATSDAAGRYVIERAPPGDVQVLAVAEGLVPGETVRFEVADGLTAEAPELALAGGPVLAGRVVDGAGDPIAGVHVRWFTGVVARPESWDFGLAPLVHQAVGDFAFPESDADGRFGAGPLPGEAPYSLYLAKPGYPYTRVRWNPERDGPEREFVLHEGGSVEGKVVDAASEQPVTRFDVSGSDRIDREYRAPSAWNPYSGAQLVEDEAGRFLVRDVRTPEAELTFRAAGYHPRLERFALAEGETLGAQVVRLVPGGTVRGRVLDRARRPVAGAQVSLLAGGGWSLARTLSRVRGHRGAGEYADTPGENLTNALLSFGTGAGFLDARAVTSGPDGSFTLESAEPGRWSVVARRRGHALGQSAPFTLTEGANVSDVEVVLSTGATLYGRVTDRFDRPVPSAILLAVSPNQFSGDQSAGAAFYQGASDADGNYEIDHMTGGTYSLNVVREGATLDPMELAGTFQFDLVVVPEDERVRKDVVDFSSATCRVFGEVRSAGRPLASGGVLALDFEAANALGLDVKAARVDARGAYEFAGLMPGRHQLVYQGGSSELRVTVDVPDAPQMRFDLDLPWGGVAGKVVALADGQPVAGARVALAREGEPELDPFVAALLFQRGGRERVTTGARGAFELAGYEPGGYLLSVEPPRGSELGTPAPVAVRVERDEITRDVVVELPAALALEGTVSGPEGGIARAWVEARASDGRAAPRRARTDEQGAFRVGGLAPGTFELVASAEGYAQGRSRPVELNDDGAEPVEIELSVGVELSLFAHGPGGEPLVGALASVFDDRGHLVSQGAPERANVLAFFTQGAGTDANGVLELGRYAPGVYRLEVWRGGARARVEPVELPLGPPLRVAVELPAR